MRIIEKKEFITKIERIIKDACLNVSNDAINEINKSLDTEENNNAKEVIKMILDNNKNASNMLIPPCQDTGIAVFFIEIGSEVQINFNINEVINECVKNVYIKYNLRKSVVSSPIKRKNTNTNTPAIINIEYVQGNTVRVLFAPKGAGSENMSQIKMFQPTASIDEIKEFVVNVVKDAGGKACPPLVVGVGIGGNFEKSAILAKKAIFRKVNTSNNDEVLNKLEIEMLDLINDTNIGPMGFGGTTTALAVHIETFACHIASLPVAVNLQCHSSRHEEVII